MVMSPEWSKETVNLVTATAHITEYALYSSGGQKGAEVGILQVFENREFGEVRTVMVENEPMFCLADVCRALEIKNVSDCKNRLIEKGVVITDTLTNGGMQKMTFINEPNLYKTIFQSRKESAERFTDWVTSEVLPSIRRTGGYNRPLTTADQIRLLAQGNTELGQRVEDVEKRIDTFETELPLLAVDCDRITNAVKARGTHFLGGLNSNAYHDKSLRQRTYSDIHREVKRQFGVSTYKAIRRNQCDRAVAFISNYDIPFVLQDEIRDCNAQITMG